MDIQTRHYCLPYIRLQKAPNQFTFTLKMAAIMCAEKLDNSQHSTRLNPESPSYTLVNTVVFDGHNTLKYNGAVL
jgi:hypothetical protein